MQAYVDGSELKLTEPGKIRLTARVAARLEKKQVPVEVIVNAYPVKQQEIVADGSMQELTFEIPIERSSWVALRIFPSVHTNPIFVMVGDQPIRASRRSAEWCLRGVDRCWKEKQKFYDEDEQEEATKAYEHARVVYRQRLSETQVD